MRAKIIVTYEADIPDGVTLEMLHERAEDYIESDMNMWITDFESDEDYQVEMCLKEYKTTMGSNEMITIQK